MFHVVAAGKLYKVKGKTKNKSKVKKFKGKSLKLGGGGRFAKGKAAIMKKGLSAKRAGAIMAVAGRKKFGAKKMAKWSAAGRKRSK